MYFLKAASLLMLAVGTSVSSSPVQQRQSSTQPASPFGFTYAFSAHLSLGKPLPLVAIPGGVLIAEPITNGTVSGPLINATITGGIATPAVFDNGTVQAPVIRAWGLTSDGFGFVINEVGTGSPKGQVTRIVSLMLRGVLF